MKNVKPSILLKCDLTNDHTNITGNWYNNGAKVYSFCQQRSIITMGVVKTNRENCTVLLLCAAQG